MAMGAVSQVTPNLIFRTYMIKHPVTGGGTGFFVEHRGQSFFITAAHVLPGFTVKDKLSLAQPLMQNPLDIEIEAVLPCGDNDVVVLKPKNVTVEELAKYPVKFGAGVDWMVGESVFFAGYPLGSTFTQKMGGDRRLMPFIKRANIALQTELDGVDYLFLDGVNTPGFSGGPIFKTQLDPFVTILLGIVSGYLNEPSRVNSGQQKTDLFVNLNSGIIKAHPMIVAIRAMDKYLDR